MSKAGRSPRLSIVPRDVAKRSRRKRDIQRPYMPPYATKEEIAYRFQVSISTVDQWISSGLLPAPRTIFTVKRWAWGDVEEAVARLNGDVATDDAEGSTSPDDDEFMRGIERASAKDA